VNARVTQRTQPGQAVVPEISDPEAREEPIRMERLAAQAAEELADAPDIVHPLVRVIPETGKKALFMGEHASHLDGRSIEEGRARVLELEAHATEARFVYLHQWRAGDMLMWDNRCLLHRANSNFDASRYPRVLHRTCLRGKAPA